MRAPSALAPGLDALVGVHEKPRHETLGGGLDDHRVPAVGAVVPVAGGVEHRHSTVAEVVDQVAAAGGRDRLGELVARGR